MSVKKFISNTEIVKFVIFVVTWFLVQSLGKNHPGLQKKGALSEPLPSIGGSVSPRRLSGRR